ncbi:MAG: amidohydrolase family protein [Planctomycetota bacterium]
MTPTAANRLGLDYTAEAARMGPPAVPIIDSHTHINGERAARVYLRVCDLYGIEKTVSQTQLVEAARVRAIMGDGIEFIAIPEYMAKDRRHAFTDGFLENLDRWHGDFGARCVKLWNAPRFIDFAQEAGLEVSWSLHSESRIRVADRAAELGMMFMTHIADPDTWFQTKYKDSDRYGRKEQHYEGLERMLERYPVPWIGAHMCGSPEDLAFLSGVLDRHDNLIIDTSATKWMIREVSKHGREELVAFLNKYKGRVLFGSDIVTTDEHMKSTDGSQRFAADLAGSEDQAFELYASRYWALRTMWESAYDGESNIADPDLHLVEPDRYSEMDAPRLVGRSLDAEYLRTFYRGAAEATVLRWYSEH